MARECWQRVPFDPIYLACLPRHRKPADDAGAAVDRVGVTRLVLTDFRNYREARLTLGTAPVVLTGPNGAGKTNLLEAVSFLAPGRGLRGAKLAEIDRRPRPRAGCRDRRLGCRRGRRDPPRQRCASAPGATRTAGERRVVRIDGEPVRGQAALGERLGVVMADPADGPAVPRRPGRTAALSRSARARSRPGARLARRGL